MPFVLSDDELLDCIVCVLLEVNWSVIICCPLLPSVGIGREETGFVLQLFAVIVKAEFPGGRAISKIGQTVFVGFERSVAEGYPGIHAQVIGPGAETLPLPRWQV